MLNLRLMLKIYYAGCLDLSPVILAHCSLEMCITAQNLEKKSHNPFISGSGSFSVIIVGTTGKLVTPRLRCWHDLANSTVELNIRVGIVALLIGHKTSLH